jgi:hypothetical protein
MHESDWVGNLQAIFVTIVTLVKGQILVNVPELFTMHTFLKLYDVLSFQCLEGLKKP